MPTLSAKVRTCLWFNGNGHEAAAFYISLLPKSYFEDGYVPNPEKAPLVVEFMLCGAPFMILNGGPTFTHSPAASISVLTKTQAETDHLWSSLTDNGGEESMCGWLKDRFGVSWQIVPEALPRMLSSDDKIAAQRAQAAMMKMKKLNIAALEAAFNQQ